jgi:hypothetical protein
MAQEQAEAPATDLVTRDYLDKRFAEFEARLLAQTRLLVGVKLALFVVLGTLVIGLYFR